MIQESQSRWYKMQALQSMVGGEEEEEEKSEARIYNSSTIVVSN